GVRGGWADVLRVARDLAVANRIEIVPAREHDPVHAAHELPRLFQRGSKGEHDRERARARDHLRVAHVEKGPVAPLFLGPKAWGDSDQGLRHPWHSLSSRARDPRD